MENDACDVGSENVGNPSTGDDVNSRIQALPQRYMYVGTY